MFVFLLAKPEFHSHLASWRVVIRTPDFVSLHNSLHFNSRRQNGCHAQMLKTYSKRMKEKEIYIYI
jgi:hypothetical protein